MADVASRPVVNGPDLELELRKPAEALVRAGSWDPGGPRRCC